jgi:hypothetical protein
MAQQRLIATGLAEVATAFELACQRQGLRARYRVQLRWLRVHQGASHRRAERNRTKGRHPNVQHVGLPVKQGVRQAEPKVVATVSDAVAFQVIPVAVSDSTRNHLALVQDFDL